jgi:hypothetical protein
MQSAMAQKIMPRALKEIAQLTLDEIRAELYEPSRISVTVFPYLVPLLVEGSEKTGMRFDVYLTVYPSPTEVSKGLPRYQQFVLSQNTIGDTLVYLVALDRTNVLDPTPPEVVGSQGAASKILNTYLKDWSNLLSNHTTRTAARARKVLTREGVAAMGALGLGRGGPRVALEASLNRRAALVAAGLHRRNGRRQITLPAHGMEPRKVRRQRYAGAVLPLQLLEGVCLVDARTSAARRSRTALPGLHVAMPWRLLHVPAVAVAPRPVRGHHRGLVHDRRLLGGRDSGREQRRQGDEEGGDDAAG